MKRARIDKEGYHYLIIVKGQRDNPMFFSNDDMGAFINILKQVLDDTDISLFAYSVTRTEYQLLVYRHNTPLKTFMSKLETAYAIYFNKKYETVGHVHQGRYDSYIILNEEYNIPIVINSIHYLPQEHDEINDFRDYPFSSVKYYNGGHSYIEELVKYNYNNKIRERDYECYEDSIGSKVEYLALLKRKPGREKSKNKEKRIHELNKLLDTLLKKYKLDKDVFEKHRLRSQKEKKKIRKIVEEMKFRGYSQGAISGALGMHRTTLNKIINRE
ncbi:MAG: hypothetical protein R6U31_00525 [bacterium]